MRNKVIMVLIGLTLTLSMVLGILAGCGTPATPTGTVAPTGTVKPTGTATVKPTGTVAPTPTKAGEVIKWRCQSSASAGDATYWCQQEMTENIKIASNGRFEWELFPNGAIVSRNEAFDAVSTGAIECTPSASENDWGGKDQLFEVNNIPAGMEQWVAICWTNYTTKDDKVSPGGKLLEGLYAKFNIKAIISGNKGAEVEYLANKKISQPADYKGLTFRGAGWELDVISQPEFGAKPVFIPTADIYSSLQTGVIDACESGTAYSNYVNGYADITKYWGFPGLHNLNQTTYSMINMDSWNSLTPDLQKVVELSLHQQMITTAVFNFVESAKILPTVAAAGVNLVYQSPEVQNFWRRMMLQSTDQRAVTNPQFKVEVLKALEWQYMLDAYADLMHPVYDLTYPGKKENLENIQF